jgi:hypothetical protein
MKIVNKFGIDFPSFRIFYFLFFFCVFAQFVYVVGDAAAQAIYTLIDYHDDLITIKTL